MAERLPPGELKTAGSPFLVVPDGRNPTVSREGTLVYAVGAEKRRLAVLDAKGEPERWIGGDYERLSRPTWSPDGARIAVSAGDSDDVDIVIVDVEDGELHRLTFQPGIEARPSWSPSGSEISFLAGGALWVVPVDGSGQPRRVIERADTATFTPDGRGLVFSVDGDIWYRDLDEGSDPVPVIRGPETDSEPMVSPDGHYVVFQRTDDPDDAVLVAEFPSGENPKPVAGGRLPQWSFDGGRLYYAERAGEIRYVVVSTDSGLSVGEPRPMSRPRTVGQSLSRTGFAVSRDDQRVVAPLPSAEEHAASRIVVVRHWLQEFAEHRR